jgi:hypothetical protein
MIPNFDKIAPRSEQPELQTPLGAVGDGSEPAAKNGHDKAGKFVAGNKCGRGNPHARRQAELRGALLGVMTPERMAALAEVLFSASLAGDWVAAKLLLSHCIGKPSEAVEPDRLDLHEWAIVNESPTLAQFLRARTDSCDPKDAASEVRKQLPSGPLNDYILERVKADAQRGNKDWIASLAADTLAEKQARAGQ